METTKLEKILDYAVRNVDYYKNLYSEFGGGSLMDFFDQLPQLQKTELIQNMEQHVSNEYKRYPHNQYVDLRRTSGSTGHFLRIMWDKRDNVKSLVPLWRMRHSYYGIVPEDKCVSFYTSTFYGNKLVQSPESELHDNGKNLTFCKINLSEERLEQIIKDIYDYEPVWFNLQPSIAMLLADAYRKNRNLLPKSLRYIELTGEYLTESVRNELQEIFQVPMANQYGCNEANSLAMECPCGHLHLLCENALTEVYHEGKPVLNQEGEIVITSLTNHAMPFIKYALGDRGKIITGQSCACGNENPILQLTYGRANNYILLKNGRRLSVYVLIHIILTVSERTNHIIEQFQIIQHDYDNITLRLVLKKTYEGWKPEVENMFTKFIVEEENLKTFQYHFEYTERIYPDEKTGKLASFIQLTEGDTGSEK